MTQIVVMGQIWNYEEITAGTHGGLSLLVLHGWGRTGAEWVQMASELGRKAYVVDLPGFGGSTLPEVKNIQEYTELVVRFCEYMALEKIVVVGHSLGGRVGIVMAVKYPKMVEKLVLVDPAGVRPRSIKRVILKILAKMFGWVPTSLRHKVVSKVMDEDYKNFPALRELYRAVIGEDLCKFLPKIKCPTWVIWGEKDKILPLSLTKVYREKIDNCRVRVIWEAGHDPHLSHPQKLERVLEEIWI